jgi:nucleoside-triphosphatase
MSYYNKYIKYKYKYVNLRYQIIGGGKKNILLTGVPGTGKSFALNKIVDELKLKYDLIGLITLEILDKNETRIGFKTSLVNDPEQKQQIAYLGSHENGTQLGKWTIYPDKLEKLLEQITLKPKYIIIIDEIAPMQIISEKFRKFVEKSLDSNNIVIGTIKLDDSNFEFIRDIKKRDDVNLIEMTLDNRNSVPKNVIDLVEELQKK